MVARRTSGPTNPSRAAGAPAPASVAASAPPPVGGFYDAGDGPAEPPVESPLRATYQQTFTDGVRRDHVAIESMGSADVDVVEAAAADALEDPQDLASEIERIRQFRRPLGAYQQKLALPPRRGYHRHWFNDVAGRIDEAKANGWTHVKGTDGKPVARCVGSGRDRGSLYGFAMEIPDVFWQEDQDARHRAASEKVEALKASPFRAPQGAAQASDKGKFYDPSESAPLQVEKR